VSECSEDTAFSSDGRNMLQPEPASPSAPAGEDADSNVTSEGPILNALSSQADTETVEEQPPASLGSPPVSAVKAQAEKAVERGFRLIEELEDEGLADDAQVLAAVIVSLQELLEHEGTEMELDSEPAQKAKAALQKGRELAEEMREEGLDDDAEAVGDVTHALHVILNKVLVEFYKF